MSASAFSLSAAIPAEGFAVTAGEPVVGGLHGASRHFFCGWCMSWMFTRPEGMDWFVNLRPTMLDDPSWFEPLIETYVAEKLPWAVTGAPHSFATLPRRGVSGAYCRVCGAGTEARKAMILCVAGEGRLATRERTSVTQRRLKIRQTD